MDLISVIVPVYNNELYVETCIRSLLEQSWENLEILAIDDGSRDRSGAILDSLAAQDGRVQVFHQKNGGVGSARNLGLEKASGDYLMFVDGDDYLASDYIRQMQKRAAQTDAEMVIGGFTSVKESGKVLLRQIPDSYRSGVREEWTFRIAAVWAHLYKRAFWEKHHIRFALHERGEDLPVSLFFAAVCPRIAVLPEAGYFYVQHTASAMHNFRGLKQYRLPYTALEEAIRNVQSAGVANGKEFHELFVLRILAVCYFDLARGASPGQISELCAYIERILSTYYPDFKKNPYIRLFSDLQTPFPQKAAVWLLARLADSKKLQSFGRLLEARKKQT